MQYTIRVRESTDGNCGSEKDSIVGRVGRDHHDRDVAMNPEVVDCWS